MEVSINSMGNYLKKGDTKVQTFKGGAVKSVNHPKYKANQCSAWQYSTKFDMNQIPLKVQF